MQGAAFGGAKICISGILHPQLSVLFTVHTNAIVVTIRITIGDMIAEVQGAATKTFARGGKHTRAATDNLRQSVSEVMNNVEEHTATVHCVHLHAEADRRRTHAVCCRLQHTRRDPSITCRSGRGPWSGLQSPAPSHATTPCIPVFAGPPPGYDRAAWRGTLAIYGSEANISTPRLPATHSSVHTAHIICFVPLVAL